MPVHVLLHAWGVCHGAWAPCSYTHTCMHGCWVCSVCAPRVHVQLLCAPSLHMHNTLCASTAHAAFAHPLQAPHMPCASTAGSVLCTLSTLSCSRCAHSFHTRRARSVCALCKRCTHPLCSHSLHTHHRLCACPMQMLSACSHHRLHAQELSARTLSAHCAHSEHTPSAGTLTEAMQVQWTPRTLHTRSAHALCSLSCTLPVFSPCAPHVLLHALCILFTHRVHTCTPSCLPPCTLCALSVCPPARSMHAFSVQCSSVLSACSMHTLRHSLCAMIACSLCTCVCFLHAPCTLVPARKPLKRCPRKMGDGRGELWAGSIGN